MHEDDDDMESAEQISLLHSLRQEWIKLPLAVMQDVGSAVQTFGGLLKITNRETFVRVSAIAKQSRLPIKSVRNHLKKLDEADWIKNHGRQKTRAGRLRRTVTTTLTGKAKKNSKPYGVLPWWACCHIRRVGKVSWSAKAVLSVIMARVMSLNAAVEEQDGYGLDVEEMEDSIEKLGGEDRFSFSLDQLEKLTGLHRESIVTAKRTLCRLQIIHSQRRQPTRGEAASGDLLVPNWEFRVRVTPASPGTVWLDFEGGSESGHRRGSDSGQDGVGIWASY